MVWWPDCEHRSVLLGSPVVKKRKRARKADNQTLSASFLKNFSEFMLCCFVCVNAGGFDNTERCEKVFTEHMRKTK